MRGHALSLILLALPTEARHSGNINGLPPSLGKITPVEFRGVSKAAPKRSGDPPQKENPAALAGANGAKVVVWDSSDAAKISTIRPATQGVLSGHLGVDHVGSLEGGRR